MESDSKGHLYSVYMERRGGSLKETQGVISEEMGDRFWVGKDSSCPLL